MRLKLPKVGMRMVKSGLAVFVCLVISALFFTASNGLYMVLAAVLCIQPDVHGSVRTGMRRLLGTVIGALYGLLTMLLLGWWSIMPQLLSMVVVSLVVLLCIYTNVLVRSPASSYITCVIYLSIVLAHFARSDLLFYVSNRFIETALGVLVAVAINLIPIGLGTKDEFAESEYPSDL